MGESENATAPAAASEGEPRGGKLVAVRRRLRVLLVDDEPRFLESLKLARELSPQRTSASKVKPRTC